jgi:hypothetical protein
MVGKPFSANSSETTSRPGPKSGASSRLDEAVERPPEEEDVYRRPAAAPETAMDRPCWTRS